MRSVPAPLAIAGVLLVASAAATAQTPAPGPTPPAPPTLKAILLDQLHNSHDVQDWFVPASKAVAGMTFEQAIAKPPGKDNHSVAQLVNHLTFWNKRNLTGFKGEKPGAFSGNNEETFTPPKDQKSWEAAVAEMDAVMKEWEKAVEGADDAKLAKWWPRICKIGQHNAYHTGQILYVRKLQGSWDPEKGVKS